MQDESIPLGESRLRHLRITVTDIDASLSWYHGMGFLDVAEHVLVSGDFVGLKSADGSSAIGRAHRMKLPDEAAEVVLTDWSNPKSHGQHPVDANHAGLFRTAVGVDDTVASYERFLADGWKFEREPRQVELEGTAVPDMWICFLNDPDGVPFEFVQRPRSAFRPERT
jgi:catechol 2,3-dioxygenase-like lactoylglutathione lyase family enzyme